MYSVPAVLTVCWYLAISRKHSLSRSTSRVPCAGLVVSSVLNGIGYTASAGSYIPFRQTSPYPTLGETSRISLQCPLKGGLYQTNLPVRNFIANPIFLSPRLEQIKPQHGRPRVIQVRRSPRFTYFSANNASIWLGHQDVPQLSCRWVAYSTGQVTKPRIFMDGTSREAQLPPARANARQILESAFGTGL